MVLLIHPKIINLNHKGRAKAKVIAKCLVLVKIYGKSPKKLLNMIIENSEIKIRVDPFIFLIFNKILNSLWSLDVILIHIILYREGINQ
jgi:hypothetical protein